MRRALLAVPYVLAALIPADGGRASAAGPAPSRIELNELQKLYEPVGFDHEGHVEIAGGCRACHHQRFGKLVSCGLCHTEFVEREQFDHQPHERLGDCLSCHQVATMAEMRCSACHKPTYDPERLHVIGLKGAFHQQCMGCHDELGMDVSCEACHRSADGHQGLARSR